jgi:hypothetical protein
MKIALLGSAPSSRMLAPFDDPSWEIWACSASNRGILPRSEAWFEMHATDRRAPNPKLSAYYKWLQGHPKVYMQLKDPLFPGSVEYPKNEMIEEFGDMFFTSSVAWMAALAISNLTKSTDEEKVLGFWGIDMAASDEYDYQRAGCHFFIWVARNRGINVVAPGESDILNTYPLYGYQENTHMWRKLNTRGEELDGRINLLNKEIQQKQNEMLVLRGAREGVDYALTWSGKS